MSRDPSGIYTVPAGTDGIPDTTIESAKYNGFVHDVEQDLNLPRPILAGGTGATSASQARDNLDAEVAMQTVTNYDSHVWETGSFKSAPGAINSPEGAGAASVPFVGTIQVHDAPTNNYIVVEARNLATGVLYMRKKIAGVWSAWTQDAGAGAFLEKNGGTMTGDLVIEKTDPAVVLDKQSNSNNWIVGKTLGDFRWTVILGNSIAETGTQAGSNFQINRYDDSGVYMSTPLEINRASGGTTVQALNSTGLITASGGILSQAVDCTTFNATGPVVISGAISAQSAACTTLGVTGLITAGSLSSTGLITAAGGISSQAITATSVDTTSNIVADGFILSKHSMAIDAASPILQLRSAASALYGSLSASSAGDIWIASSDGFQLKIAKTSGTVSAGTGVMCRSGQSGVYSGNSFNFNWTGTALAGYVDNSNLGNVSFTSDYRTKKDVIELPGMWDTVKRLRPIKYTQADFSPSPAAGPMFVADDIERWGFVAHELQETLVPSAATGVKDDPVNVQSPNWPHVVAALTKGLQEAMARIEALEAKHG